MYKIILLSSMLTLFGCSTCKDAVRLASTPGEIPNKMGIVIEGTDFRADEAGSKFIKDYIDAKASLALIELECLP